MSAPFTTREAWLQAFTEASRPHFEAAGAPLPERIRMAVGFPSTGKRGKAIGECWYPEASKDAHAEIFITPKIDDSARVADILTHELVHAALGRGHGHGKSFKRAATKLGLTGKMTATESGPAWFAWAQPILDQLGPIPHGALAGGFAVAAPKKQTNRMLKCECDTCGFVFRAAKTWIEAATDGLRCPDPTCEGEARPC